jgi:hypothetical protein
LYVWRDAPDARHEILRVAAIRPVALVAAGQICTELRLALVANKGPVDLTGDGVRGRAIALMTVFLIPAIAELRELVERRATTANYVWSEPEQDRVRAIVSFADLLGRELYFSTGIFQARDQREEEQVTHAQRVRLFREALSLMESLADIGLPSLAHHLLEICEENISADPRGTFVMIGRIVVAGEREGYPSEPLAEGMFVSLIGRYLAEYRTLFQEDGECKALLLRVLDIFVQAGWPSAQKLSYRLDEIFR